MDDQIRDALNKFDIDSAHKLLRIALSQNPTAETYYLGSKVAFDDKQKLFFLQEAVKRNPFHKNALEDLKKLNVTNAPQPNFASSPQPTISKSANFTPGVSNSSSVQTSHKNPVASSFKDRFFKKSTLYILGSLMVVIAILVTMSLLHKPQSPPLYFPSLINASPKPIVSVPNKADNRVSIIPGKIFYNSHLKSEEEFGKDVSVADFRIINTTQNPVNVQIIDLSGLNSGSSSDLSIGGYITKTVCGARGCFQQTVNNPQGAKDICRIDSTLGFATDLKQLTILPKTFTLNPQEEITGAAATLLDNGGLDSYLGYTIFYKNQRTVWNPKEGITN